VSGSVTRWSSRAQTSATLDETIIQSDSPQLKTFGKIESKDVGGNGSTPFAVEQNAGFAFNFTGSAVAVYSPPYGDGVPLRAQYAVYFNSSIPPSATDRMWLVLPGQTNGNGALQFFAAGLPEGEHRVALVNLLGGGQAFGASLFDPRGSAWTDGRIRLRSGDHAVGVFAADGRALLLQLLE
jgi:hypothetical protein